VRSSVENALTRATSGGAALPPLDFDADPEEDE
jgi:hypothetical protein